MSSDARDFEETAEAQGWSDATQLGVLMDFIDNYADKAKLCEYAEQRAQEENALGEDWWSQTTR